MNYPYLRGVLWTMSSETLKSRSFVRKLLSPPRPGGLFFSSAFGRGLEREVEGASKVSRGRTCGYRPLTTFSNNKKMVIILHRELEHKVEKVQHMKLEVMRPKTKNNMNYQP